MIGWWAGKEGGGEGNVLGAESVMLGSEARVEGRTLARRVSAGSQQPGLMAGTMRRKK